MPISDLQRITVTGKFFNLDDTPANGSVEFVASVVLKNDAKNEIIYPTTFSANLVQGAFSIALPATNDPDITPVDWYYTVTEKITGSTLRRTYNVQLPYDAPGGTVDLADLVPVVTVPSVGAAGAVDGGSPSTVF